MNRRALSGAEGKREGGLHPSRLLALLLLASRVAVAGDEGEEARGAFRDRTKESGIRVRIAADLRRLKMISTMIGGCALGDYDGDGAPDLYVASSVPHWGRRNGKNCGRLYRNLGDGRFEDVSGSSGIRACGLGMGAFWADLDGDGLLDLYLTNVGPNTVYWNRGDGSFEEGRGTGLEDPLFSIGAAFLDYDRDGRLDVVVGNYLDSTPQWEAAQPQLELRVPEDYSGQPSHLYRNEGSRRFRDVTRAAGLAMDPAGTKTLGIAVLDYDADGLPDLYFVNDRASNRLFRNRGDGRFEETTAETGAGVLGQGPRAGMGVAAGDPFGEGRPSLFVTNFGGEPNSYYRNVEGVLFEDWGAAAGADDVGLSSVRWGTHFADFDNDGRPDLYAVGGHLAPRIVRRLGRYRSGRAKYVGAGDPAYRQLTVLLRNAGERRFEEWKNSGDLARIRMAGRGSAVADVEGDGDLDLFVVDLAGRSRLFENLVGDRASWIRIEPVTGPDRKTPLGTRVRITAEGRTQTQWFEVSASYASGSLTPLHFGLGSARVADEIEIRWPEGGREVFRGVAARVGYRVERGEGLKAAPRSDTRRVRARVGTAGSCKICAKKTHLVRFPLISARGEAVLGKTGRPPA